MSIDIKVPPLGESVTEATIGKWHKKAGDAIKKDDLLVELETDKITMEVHAETDGTLEQIIAAEGSAVAVGDKLGTIASGKAAAAPAPAKAPEKVEAKKESAPEKILSPAANKIATEKQIPVSQISGTGRDGRVTKEDVLSYAPSASKAVAAGDVEERVRMTSLRKKIAERLKYSQNTAAILTTFNEVDLHNVMELRNKHKDTFAEMHKVKLGFMSFFVKATIQALKAIPAINAEIDGDDIVYKKSYHIGVAVGTEKGLVVPVLRNADQLSFAGIESEIAVLAKKAKEGKLSMEDLSGGTFSITNGGTYGSLLSTPIINPPQSGILGMHNIVKRPVVVNDQIVIRPMMYIALSYDHRIIDGKDAVTFLVKIKEYIENPELFLLNA